jgi:hypothetical protein
VRFVVALAFGPRQGEVLGLKMTAAGREEQVAVDPQGPAATR